MVRGAGAVVVAAEVEVVAAAAAARGAVGGIKREAGGGGGLGWFGRLDAGGFRGFLGVRGFGDFRSEELTFAGWWFEGGGSLEIRFLGDRFGS